MPRPRTRPRPNGFTLVEMMGALLLVIVIGSLFLAAPRPSPRAEAGDAARRIRAMLTAALAEAELDGGEVIVRAEAVAAEGRSGRFLALSGPPGVMPEDDPAADWVELADGVVWRAGTASADPAGVPTDGRVPGSVRCTAEACETGAADHVVYFVGHARSARVSWALVLTRERAVQLFRWDATSNTWKTEAP
ncbi:MAG TPA: hypothetical protein VF746_24410 [Longimicrobium sp.]|jgi:type II secretory pathway pseudopilin PulG